MYQGGSAAHRDDCVIGAAAGVAGSHEFVVSAVLATFQLVAS